MRAEAAQNGPGLLGGGSSFAAAACACALAACATVPPAEREVREYARVDAELSAADRFRALSRACRDAGGVVYVARSMPRRALTALDMSSAGCSVPVRRPRP